MLPRFFRTLHFRLSAVFLLLLAAGAAGYYFWVDATVFSVDTVPGEDRWYDDLAKGEIDSMALVLTPHLTDLSRAESLLVDYGSRVAAFDAEVALISGTGEVLSSSGPDSLSKVLLHVEPALLDSMCLPSWDFDSFPNPYNIDAYENRIFEIQPIIVSGDSTQPPDAYVVASFTPLEIQVEELAADKRQLLFQAIALMLLVAAISGLIIMAWLTRRLRRLAAGVRAFAAGDFAHRVPAGSSDEIALLGGSFNAMAARLDTLIDQLRQSDQFHRQLLVNISHDLRTPLATLRGYVETLSLKGENLPPADRERFLGIIRGNLEHLQQLIEHLLTLSRLDSGQAPFRMDDFSFEELTAEVLARLEGLAAEKGITLEQEVAGELPPVHADPLQMGQALQNLVENGIKFTPAGGRVSVELRTVDQAVEVTVRDTGSGIAPEDLPHIFERFYTADKSRSCKGGSSGLGLAIAHKILHEHGRDLAVESHSGQGTSFRFTLPRAAPPA